MSIKYNQFGEVVSVNGLTVGQHLGTPMQDALGTPEENQAYGEELATVTRCENTIDDKQPTAGNSGNNGNNGNNGGGAVDVMYVNTTTVAVGPGQMQWTADKTYEEILAAIENGTQVIVVQGYEDGSKLYYHLQGLDPKPGVNDVQAYIEFCHIDWSFGNEEFNYISVRFYADGTIDNSQRYFSQMIPT